MSKFARLSLLHRVWIAFFSAIVFGAVFLLPDAKELRPNDQTLEVGKVYSIDIDGTNLSPSYEPKTLSLIRWETHKVGSGESAAILFNRIGLSPRLLHNLISSNKEINQQLSRLRPGDTLKFGFDENNELIHLNRQLNAFETFSITRADDRYTSQLKKKEVNVQYNYAEAEITSNFWNAGVTAGLNANQIMELAGIFGWDIDFALDIRKGDNFQVLYEEKVVEGEKVGRGNIIAAIFTNQGDTFKAIRDKKTGNYYDQDGRAMKKAFLRSPVNFRYVSSNFNPRRLHPVTGRVRPHRGTDYVAPVGTPIWAAGDGIVEKAGYNKFNGNYVFIRHSSTYITKYLHLKKRSVKTGQRVKQGQTVGTLGGTGRVTGPHLHYEFLVNGVHKNPRTVKLPEAKSLKGKAKQTFVANSKIRLEQLEKYKVLLQPIES
ncbi:putative Peptidase M23B [Vibrio nigripulchritudo MADA3029]|uniref:Putative Peptidase M23B n=1 Tax=Vibrio nigripulchritudo TaxID=28173 RepID=U4KE74_9VIBR|nr:peptidoglycan DD-metalloendopeptidase family protein [Vibrio nigripulchritudo]EGU59807.1 membrane protein [Vibrio nigripulchritudo ATCC 27043]CCN45215.1 putative Peptidase M23B [Vibrio nigripulchritudo MADA3020]CCN53974.1 putative Peptidase M23B [Vibrio nigripulchritudo MADA3021]CCN57603.1 putative Peptidase M23B [Vibrio nigripulchritudo MADA3029]CCN84697.1 putative Peptidase M23B [Vibrio nigripulchritudo BLFn1]